MGRFLIVVVMGLFFTIKALAFDISFSGINYAQATSPGGQTFTFSADGNDWEVNVQSDTWPAFPITQTITNTNLSFQPPFGFFINPIWPDAEGVFFRQIPFNNPALLRMTFTFTRLSGAAPLSLVLHNGESVDFERDTVRIINGASDWQLVLTENLSGSSISGNVATFEDITGTAGVGSWAVTSVITGNSATIEYDYEFNPGDASGQQGSGANMISFEVGALDYGDAPDATSGTSSGNYNTTALDSGAAHAIPRDVSGNLNNPVYLGSVPPDGDNGLQQNNTATEDGNDEDGWTPPANITINPGVTNTYTTPITVTTASTANASISAWIDWNQNGVFETSERASATYSTDNSTGSVDLTFTNIPSNLTQQTTFTTYARFRACTTTSECSDPTGIASDGEIEDYQISIITLPVTLSHFNSIRSGNKVDIDWTTGSELFNVGFQLWGQGLDGQWEKLHNWLVRSGSGNAVEPQSYRKRVRIPSSIDELVRVGISSVDNDGTEHYYGPFDVGVSYGELSSLEPIAWDEVRAEVDARMSAKGYIKDRVNGYRKVTSVSDAVTSSGAESMVEFTVSNDGMYRITASELLAAGINWQDVRKGDIALLNHTGHAQVPYVWARGDGRGLNKTLGAQGEIYFYGQSPDEAEGLYTDSSVYRLVLDRYQALRAQTQRKQGVQTGYSEYYIEHVEMENDALYVLNSTADDPWLSQVVLSYPEQPRLYGLQIPVEADARWDQSATLSLGLGRSSALTSVDSDNDGVQDPEHRVDGLVVSSGEIMNLGTETATGSGEWGVSYEIPANTPLSITDGHVVVGGAFSAGAGYTFSEIHVDSMGLSYARPYVAKGDDQYLLFKGPDAGESGYEVVIPDRGWPWVFASDGSNLVRIGLESQARQTSSSGAKQRVVRFAKLNQIGNTQINYWVSGKPGFLSVSDLTENTISTHDALLSQAAGSNLLIVAHPAFMGEALTGYAEFKRSQGDGVAIVDYLEIVETFGGGQPGPLGLTEFLSALEVSTGVENVLLVGGSTYDHTDRQGAGAVTFIPGHYGESDYSKFTVSDVPYITGSDNQLFATIGRWPVRSQSDLEVIVAKSIAWSEDTQPKDRAVLIAEHTVAGEHINFGSALDGVAELLPQDYDQRRVYVDEVAADNNLTLPGDLTQALTLSKASIIDALNTTPDVVLYNGHASTRQLSNQNLFKSSDIGQITSSGAEVWLPLSCYITFYESTHVNTLAHQLMFKGNAVTITGATLLSNQGSNIQMGTTILNSTVNEGAALGEAVNKAKAVQSSPTLNINWALLGDPTVRF